MDTEELIELNDHKNFYQGDKCQNCDRVSMITDDGHCDFCDAVIEKYYLKCPSCELSAIDPRNLTCEECGVRLE